MGEWTIRPMTEGSESWTAEGELAHLTERMEEYRREREEARDMVDVERARADRLHARLEKATALLQYVWDDACEGYTMEPFHDEIEAFLEERE